MKIILNIFIFHEISNKEEMTILRINRVIYSTCPTSKIVKPNPHFIVGSSEERVVPFMNKELFAVESSAILRQFKIF